MGLLDFLQGTLGIGGGPDINQTIAGGGATPGGWSAGLGDAANPQYFAQVAGQQQQQAQMQHMMRQMMLSAVLGQIGNRNNPRAGNPMAQIMPMMMQMMRMQQEAPILQARAQREQQQQELLRRKSEGEAHKQAGFQAAREADPDFDKKAALMQTKQMPTAYESAELKTRQGIALIREGQQEREFALKAKEAAERSTYRAGAEARGKERLNIEAEAQTLRRDVLEHPEKYPGAKKGTTKPSSLPEYPEVTDSQYRAGLALSKEYHKSKSAYEGIINDYSLAQKHAELARDGKNAQAQIALVDDFVRAAQGFDPNLGKRMNLSQAQLIQSAQPGREVFNLVLSGKRWASGGSLTNEGINQILSTFKNYYSAAQERVGELGTEYINRGTGAGLPEGAAKRLILGEAKEGTPVTPAKAGGIPPPPAGMKKASEYMRYLQSQGYSTEEAYKAAQDAAGGQ